MPTRLRLDALLVKKGLVDSRERARALIMAGQVDLDGRGAAKPGTMVTEDADVRVIGPEHPWVSRGGLKLAHALDVFGLDVTGRVALDIGASTGGFTDVLLTRGARQVLAVDVGHGQLHWKLRTDPRVEVYEKLNAREMTRADLPALPPDGAGLVTLDVSFISLRLVFPALPPLLAPDADIVALVKPQFEAGRRDARKGIVRDPAVHARVVEDIAEAGAAVGWLRMGMTESPITGAQGNREFLLHFRAAPGPAPVSAHDGHP